MTLLAQMQRDFLIIGQGLAGSLLAWRLLQQNQTFHIVDNGAHNASKVAAGLINPVTGKRFVKEANFERLINVAKTLYYELETSLQSSFFVERPLLRVLKNQSEIDTAKKRIEHPEYNSYLKGNIKTIASFRRMESLIEQKQTGFIYTQRILCELKNLFVQKQSYINTEFDHSDLDIQQHGINWRGTQYQQLIFCDGDRVRNNPFFKHIPWQPVKGETLTLSLSEPHCIELLQEFILNYGYWLVQITPTEYRTGATFTREELIDQPTEAARTTLLEALHKYLGDIGITVTRQDAAIRLATPDRQPVMGSHADYKHIYIFNGFGSKGAIKIPYYSLCLLRHILQKQALPDEVELERFHSA